MCNVARLGFDISATAGWYSAIAGLLAGFAMLSILLPLDHKTKERGEHAQRASASGVIVFTSAFFSLLILSFTYAILSGRPMGEVAVHEQQINGVALGLAALLMILGLREILRLYGGNRRMLSPAKTLIARVTGIMGPIILVAFSFSNALDVEAFRSAQQGSDCTVGLPSGLWLNIAIAGLAVLLILLVPVAGRRWHIDSWAAATIGYAILIFTAAVAVWSAAIVPFLPENTVSGPMVEHVVFAIAALGAVAFSAAAWLSRTNPMPKEDR